MIKIFLRSLSQLAGKTLGLYEEIYEQTLKAFREFRFLESPKPETD